MEVEIKELDKYTFNDSIQLLQRFYKEHKGELIHRVEAESILKNPNNKTIVLTIDGNVRGLYTYEDAGEVYLVRAFVLHPLVRKKKIGYTLWKEMNERLKAKPAIIGIIKRNEAIRNIIRKRGHFIGVGIDNDLQELEFYNLTFKDKDK